MPCPCCTHAVSLRVYVSFPFDLHSVVVSDSHLPCHAHAMLRPCRSPQGHGTAHPSRDGLWDLPAFGFFRLPCEVPQRLFNRSIPVSDADGQCETKQHLSWMRKRVVAAHYKRDNLLNCWISSSDISGYHADFHEGHGTIGAWQGHGMACVS